MRPLGKAPSDWRLKQPQGTDGLIPSLTSEERWRTPPVTPTPPKPAPVIPIVPARSGYTGDAISKISSPLIKSNAERVPVPSAPIIPPGIDKASLAGIISAVMDTIGGGMMTYGGRTASTRLMDEGKAKIQSDNTMRLMAAETEQKTKLLQMQLDAELAQKIKMLPLELQAETEKAKALGDIDRVNQILIANGILPAQKELAYAQRAAGILGGGNTNVVKQGAVDFVSGGK